jgi:hypothetical protein
MLVPETEPNEVNCKEWEWEWKKKDADKNDMISLLELLRRVMDAAEC